MQHIHFGRQYGKIDFGDGPECAFTGCDDPLDQTGKYKIPGPITPGSREVPHGNFVCDRGNQFDGIGTLVRSLLIVVAACVCYWLLSR